MKTKCFFFSLVICLMFTSFANSQEYDSIFYEDPEFWVNEGWRLFKVEHDDFNNGTIDQVNNFTYDADQKLTKIETSLLSGQGGTTYYIYDSSGNVIRQENDFSNDGSIDMVMYFTLNSSGNPVKMEMDNENNGSIDSVTTFTYDSNDNKTKEVMKYSTAGVTFQNITTFEYDGDGNLIKETGDFMGDGFIDEVTDYAYNSKNKVIKKSFDLGNTGFPAEVTTYSYDPSDRLVKEEFDDANDGTIDETVSLYYDSKGNLNRLDYKYEGNLQAVEHLSWDTKQVEMGQGECTYEIISPNGEEVWCTESYETIEWKTSGGDCAETVKLEYTDDNGNTWEAIASDQENDGSYAWKTPESLTSTQALVRVTDETTQRSDKSDATFTVCDCSECAIVITEPNGGETWAINETYEIKWVTGGSNCGDNVKIMVSEDSGNLWESIIHSTPNNGSYLWTIPEDIYSDEARIKIEDTSASANSDVSNADFKINTTGDDDSCFIGSIYY